MSPGAAHSHRKSVKGDEFALPLAASFPSIFSRVLDSTITPGTCRSGFKVPTGSNAAELGHICGQLSLWRIAMFVMVRGSVCPRGRRPPALHRPSSVSKLFVFITLSGAVKLSKPTTSVCFRGFAYIHGYSEWLGAGESVSEFEREGKIGFRSGW